MFAKITDWKLIYISKEKREDDMMFITDEQHKILQDWGKYENWEFVDITKSPEYIKAKKIRDYKKIENEAMIKRTEYLTAELLPDWEFKTLKLFKLENERINIEEKYNECVNSLINEYWKEILNELI